MKAIVAAAGVLTVLGLAVGFPLARTVGRSRAWSLAATPAATGIAVSVAVGVSVLTRTSMVPWLLLITALGWAYSLRRGVRWDARAREEADALAVLLVAAAVAVVPVLLVKIPAVESDARSSWWFHATIFRLGGDVAAPVMAEPVFRFSRPAYPPLVPGVIASVWHAVTPYNNEVALRVSQLLVGAAAATTGFVVATVAGVRRGAALVAAALVTATCWGVNAEVGLSGFVDLTWPLFLAPAAVLVLAGRLDDRRNVAVAALLAAAAALTKTEAQFAAVLLVGWFGLRCYRAGELRRVVPLAASVVAAIVGWTVVTTVTDAPTEDRGDLTRVFDLVRPGTEAHDRFVDTASSLARECGLLVGLAVLGILAVVAICRLAGVRIRQSGLLSLLGLAFSYLFVLAVSLAISNEALDGYFETGTYRYVLFARVLVLLDLLLAWIAALRVLGVAAPRADEPEAGPEAEAAEPVAAAAGGSNPGPGGDRPRALG